MSLVEQDAAQRLNVAASSGSTPGTKVDDCSTTTICISSFTRTVVSEEITHQREITIQEQCMCKM